MLGFMVQPMLAQNQKNSRRNDNYTPTKKGTPGYYDYTVRHLFKQGLWGSGKKLLDEGLSKYETVWSLNELMTGLAISLFVHCATITRIHRHCRC